MERPNTVSGLLDKRREIAGRIEHAQGQMRQLVVELDALDLVIRLFDPEAIPTGSKPYPPRAIAFRGEISRVVLDALREAPGPVATASLAQAVMDGRGLNPDDTEMRRTLKQRVRLCLRRMKAKGTLFEVPLAGGRKGWALANSTPSRASALSQS